MNEAVKWRLGRWHGFIDYDTDDYGFLTLLEEKVINNFSGKKKEYFWWLGTIIAERLRYRYFKIKRGRRKILRTQPKTK